jgi:arginyl-tRNA synthetase
MGLLSISPKISRWARYDDFQMNRMIYIVGNEQEYHFKVLFALFAILGYDFADKCHHLSYGMIELPEGKMKSREGNVVDADTLADDLHQHAYDTVSERYPDLAEEEKHAKAESISMAAIKFYMLLQDAKNNFVFDPQASISFDGETGPYIQYTHARCCSLLEKATNYELPKADYASIEDLASKNLLLHLASRPETVQRSVDEYAPHHVARYALDLSKLFNKFYQSQQVVDEADLASTADRIALVRSAKYVLSL